MSDGPDTPSHLRSANQHNQGLDPSHDAPYAKGHVWAGDSAGADGGDFDTAHNRKASGRPTGPRVTDFAPPPAPGPANQGQDWVWDYLGYGPFADLPSYRDWQAGMAAKVDPFFYALRDAATGKVGGLAAFLRIDPANGVIEIGHIEIAPLMQRTPAATEAISLMIGWAFGAGYRRVEWKCDALNAPSRRAALRYGFVFEGVFRQHMIYKGRNRDTAWYAIIDQDWPALAHAHETWLAPENFDAQGRQRQSLSAFTVR